MQKLLSLLIIMGLLLWSAPALVVAQTEPTENNGTGTKTFLPLVRAATAIALNEEEDDTDTGLQTAGIGRELVVATPRGATLQTLSQRMTALKLENPVTVTDGMTRRKLPPSMIRTPGRKQVVVRLSEPSLVEHVLTDVRASAATQQAQVAIVERQQATILQAALQLDGNTQLLGQVQKALNAIILELDAAALPTLAANPAVQSIRPVINYALALSETVPYIGGTAVQGLGYDGTGVSVAVLDSGVDYTHANLGGAGTLVAYQAAYGSAITDTLNTTPDGLFPTAKVVGGYDFVGELWGVNDAPLAPDPDPIDLEGHGTHVADIIGGVRGVAPAADLYAVKVCSAIATACSGVALLQGMDFALDPNGDDNISDAVDVINLSLGSDYGTAEDDDLTRMVEFASAYGVIVVASAGNGGDKPYIHGTPASAPSAIAVAQTNVPSAVQPVMMIKAPATIAGDYEAVFQPWSITPSVAIEGAVQYGDGADGNRNGCAPFAPGSLTGKIVLVDRGACNFTLKISNISQGGGVVGLIGLITPGAPFSGGDGGERPITIPGYMISQATANKIKSELTAGVVLRFDPATGLPLLMHMVGSSSRGPTLSNNLLKPDIGAPGASVSAVAGSGTGEGAFGGTSGAAPMVAGAAALLRQAYPTRAVAEIKALLMNTAETNIMNGVALFGGTLAPITRIGGGEVRVDRAVASPAAAWDVDAQTGSLSFTFQDVTDELTLKRLVNVRNYSKRNITYEITPTFRFENDAATHAITVETPSRVYVPAGSDAQFEVKLEVAGEQLRPWRMNSGVQGANPAPLTLHEYDGYLQLTEAGEGGSALHLAWQILPRQAGDVSLKPRSDYVQVRNRGVNTSTVESYSLIGVSSNLPQGRPGDNNPIPDLRYVGYATYPVPAGYCSEAESFILAFAINTWERQVHANAPAEFDLFIDVDQDGTFDYDVFNFDLSLASNRTDGRNVTWVADLKTGQAASFFAVDHETNSANTVLLLCGEQIGMSAANFLKPINLEVVAFDAYYQGWATDALTGITIAPLGEQYVGVFESGGVGATQLAYDQRDKLQIIDQGQVTNNTESGLLLLFRGGAALNREAGTVVILP